MARCTIFGRRFIEEYGLGTDKLYQLMTICAAHILMRAPQGKRGAFFVVEKRRLPFHAVVTFGAAGNVGHGKLLPMHVFVAVLALGRRSLEIHVN